MHTAKQPEYRDVPWQQAVYTRRNARDPFTFSHVEHTAITKAFLPSLAVPCLTTHPSNRRRNADTLTETPVLILVTGNWAQEYSIATFCANHNPIPRQHTPAPRHHRGAHAPDPERIPSIPFDHVRRLSARSAPCSELTAEYRTLEYHRTLAHYEAGELSGCIPFLSDSVIVPRVLHPPSLMPVMRHFHRALKKTLRDSLLMAGSARYKEETLALVVRPPCESGSPCPVH
jgi:hypothetical protein